MVRYRHRRCLRHVPSATFAATATTNPAATCAAILTATLAATLAAALAAATRATSCVPAAVFTPSTAPGRRRNSQCVGGRCHRGDAMLRRNPTSRRFSAHRPRGQHHPVHRLR
jgi:hypothetical protein